MNRRIRLGIVVLVLLTIVCCLPMANQAKDATEKEQLVNILDGALSQDHFSSFFDISRGKPEMLWQDEMVCLKSGFLYSKKPLASSNYTLSVDVYSMEDSLQLRLDVGRMTGKSSIGQITIDSSKNAILAFDGVDKLVTRDFAGTLTTGKWYQLTVQTRANNLYVYINGRQEMQMQNEEGYAGNFSIRSNTGPIFLKNLSCYEAAGPVVDSGDRVIGFLNGYDDMVLPGLQQNVTFCANPGENLPDSLSFEVCDAAGTVYEAIEANDQGGQYHFSYVPRGSVGWQTIRLSSNGQRIGAGEVYVQTKTTVRTGDESFDAFFQTVTNMITDRDLTVYNFDGNTFKMYMSWLRDHIHMMEAGIYFRENFCNIMDFWLEHQHEDGFFYEMILQKNTPTYASFTANSDRKFYKKITDDLYVLRFEIEADIEYLVVDGVYMTWQATGDNGWMESTLDNLDKALTWTMTNPERWSEAYGLPIRGHSVDTYDFVYGQSHDRRINWWEEGMTKGTPMAIFHGDCTGFYQACNQLAEMYRVAGNESRARYWENIGKNVQRNLIKTTWNGSFFAHMVQIHPKVEDLPESYQEDFSGDWNRLSYSNACALNRGFLTQAQASSIIEAFMEIRDNPPAVETVDGHSEEKLFAEWVTIYPSYRYNLNSPVNYYMNGCIAPFCGGELANGCFKWGAAEYGYNILTRMKQLCERDGKLRFFYYQNGSQFTYGDGSEGGPSAWGAASVHNAIVEGLAGFADGGTLLDTVTLTPSWTVTEFSDVYAAVSYGQRNCYVAYKASVDKASEAIRYQIVGSGSKVNLQLLMPSGFSPKEVWINGTAVKFETVCKEDSVYATLSYEQTDSTEINTVEVRFKEGLPQKLQDSVVEHNLFLIVVIILSAVIIVGVFVFFVITVKKRK